MAYSVRFSAEAAADVESIATYLSEMLHSPQAAGRFLAELEEQVSLMEDLPLSFPEVREPHLHASGYRKAHVMRHVAVFRVETQAVYIARLFHQSQDYARLL